MTDLYGSAESADWDLTSVALFLSADTDVAAEDAWADALPTLSEQFRPELWRVSHSTNEYGPGAHNNLFNVECPREFRQWLEQSDTTAEDYAAAVGPIQYVSIEMNLLTVMRRGLSNTGWRVRVMGFPALGIVACGLASHYQGTQNQNLMGRASGLIRARALDVLTGETRDALERWPSATSADWEERGLMPEPVLHIGALDIASFDAGQGAKLRMVRNTTVKKELATFFALRGLTVEGFQDTGVDLLLTLREIALELGRPSDV